MDKLSQRVLKAASGYVGANRVTIEELAVKCRTTPAAIYKRMQNAEFRVALVEILKRSLIPEVPPVLDSVVKSAKQGSYKHQVLMLKLAGVYTDEKKVLLDGKVDVGETPFASREEAADFLKATAERVSEHA